MIKLNKIYFLLDVYAIECIKNYKVMFYFVRVIWYIVSFFHYVCLRMSKIKNKDNQINKYVY